MEVFDKNWFLEKQTPLLWFANTRYGKDILGISDSSIFRDDKIDFILPNALIKRIGEKEYIFEFRSSNKYSKRLMRSFKPIWKAFHWFDMNIANIYAPRLNLGFDTFNPAAGNTSPLDGIAGITTDTASWSTLRNSNGNIQTAVETTLDNRLRTMESTTNYREMRRVVLLFNTSALADDFVVGETTLTLYGHGLLNQNGDINGYVCASDPASTSSLSTADYNIANWGSTSFGYIAYDDFSTSAYNDISLNTAGKSAISLTGITKLGFRNHWDFENTTTGQSLSKNSQSRMQFRSADYGSGSPRLTIVAKRPGGNAIFFGTNF